MPLRFLLVLELSIEAKHALTASRTRSTTNLSASLYSFELRIGEVRRRMGKNDQWWLDFVDDFSSIMRPELLLSAFGLQNHPSLDAELAKTNRLTWKPVKQAFYHSDLYAQYLGHEDARSTMEKFFADKTDALEG